MPELPEAETVARTIYPHICNCVFTDSQLLRSATLHPLSLPLSALNNLVIRGTRRRGKLIIFDLGSANNQSDAMSPSILLFHLRMTGRLMARNGAEDPIKHTRCYFNLRKPDGDAVRLFFNDTRAFGQIFAATPHLLDSWDFWRNLGPEPLEIDTDTFAQRLNSNRAIKIALMDQSVVAGIGNIYADESLFKSGINPLRPAKSLSMEEVDTLLHSMQDVLRLSISQCGSSIRDYVDADGNAGSFQNSFTVYGRGGKNCYNCGQPLEKMKVGGRATVFCKECQK